MWPAAMPATAPITVFRMVVSEFRQYLDTQSSSFCLSPATTAFDQFLRSWTPAATISTVAPTVAAIGSSETAMNVSFYFTPSVTATIPLQTAAIGPGASGLMTYDGPGPTFTPTPQSTATMVSTFGLRMMIIIFVSGAASLAL